MTRSAARPYKVETGFGWGAARVRSFATAVAACAYAIEARQDDPCVIVWVEENDSITFLSLFGQRLSTGPKSEGIRAAEDALMLSPEVIAAYAAKAPRSTYTAIAAAAHAKFTL